MIPKGEACKACPLWQGGGAMVPDRPGRGAIVVMGQNPGASETAGHWWEGKDRWHEGPVEPFIGASGQMLRRRLLPLLGVDSDDVTLANAVRCRWRGTDKLPPLGQTVMRDAIAHCQRSYGAPLAGATLTVTLGEYALYTMTGIRTLKGRERGEGDTTKRQSAIEAWRGWALPAHALVPSYVWTPQGHTVFATYHPAFIFRSPMDWPVLQSDFKKAGKLITGKWPLPFPAITDLAPDPTKWVAFDTEFHVDTRSLRHWSWSDGERVGVVYTAVPALERVIFHNGPADWAFLPRSPQMWEDTMYAHAALYGGYPHDLNYLASFWSRTNRWKHLSVTNPEQYSAGDALGTWDVHAALQRQLDADPQARYIYEQTLRPLIPVLVRRRPIPLHRERVKGAVKRMKEAMDGMRLEAQAISGFPINLASPKQVEGELT